MIYVLRKPYKISQQYLIRHSEKMLIIYEISLYYNDDNDNNDNILKDNYNYINEDNVTTTSTSIQYFLNFMNHIFTHRSSSSSSSGPELLADDNPLQFENVIIASSTPSPLLSSPTISTFSTTTTTTQTSSMNQFNVTIIEILFWSSLFYPMVIMAAIGNLLIIWIIATKPLMRNIMNQYLMNLTLSDFLSVTFNASFNFIFMLYQHWPFGKLYCMANNFIANLTIVSSVSTMMLISIDRYYAIVHPLKPRQTKRRFFCSIGAIWIASILFSLPALLYSDTEDLVQTRLPPTTTTSSAISWPSTLSFLDENYYGSDDDDDVHRRNELSLFEANNNNNTLISNDHSSSSWLYTIDSLSSSIQSTKSIYENITLFNHRNHHHFYFDSNQLSYEPLPSPLSSSSSSSSALASIGTTEAISTTLTRSTYDDNSIENDGDFLIRTLCIMRWPDGVSGFSRYEFLYNMAFLIFFYVIPVLTMVIALALMSRVLWPKELIGEHTPTNVPHNTLIRSKRKVVCMLMCVISVFALCWLPYHSYFISIYWWPSLIRTAGIKHIYLAFYWFAMANSLFNPVILFAMNRRIRNYIKHYVKCSCCIRLLFGGQKEKLFRSKRHHHHRYHQRQLQHPQQSSPLQILNYHYNPHNKDSHDTDNTDGVRQQQQQQQFLPKNQDHSHLKNKSNGLLSNDSNHNNNNPVSLITINARNHHNPTTKQCKQQQPPINSQSIGYTTMKTMKKVEFCCSKFDSNTGSEDQRSNDRVPDDDDRDDLRKQSFTFKGDAVSVSEMNYSLNQQNIDGDTQINASNGNRVINNHHLNHRSCPSIFSSTNDHKSSSYLNHVHYFNHQHQSPIIADVESKQIISIKMDHTNGSSSSSCNHHYPISPDDHINPVSV